MNELLNFNIAIKIEHVLQAALNALLVRQDLPSRQPGRQGSFVAQAQRAPTLYQPGYRRKQKKTTGRGTRTP